MKRRETRVPLTLENVRAAGSERKCKCRVGPEAVGKRWSQTIILAHPGGESQRIILAHPGGDDSKSCPDCGGQRVVYLVHPSFPLSRECDCPECVRAIEAAEEPQPARASATDHRTPSPAPRSAPPSDPPRVPVALESAQTEEPPTEEERSSEVSESAWESQRSRRRGSFTRGVLKQDF
jgi:hypothetical protein